PGAAATPPAPGAAATPPAPGVAALTPAPNGAAAGTVPSAPAANEGLHLTWKGPTQVKAGDEVTLVLNARTGQPLAGAAVQVTFDPIALEFVRLTEGSFLKQGGASTAFNHRLDANGGLLTVRFARIGGGATGDADLMAVTFRVKEGEGPTDIQAATTSSSGPGSRMLTALPSQPHRINVSQ
ncbi:MAG TPA: cohesin domain-containing protein, partial [Albitalea sp.]